MEKTTFNQDKSNFEVNTADLLKMPESGAAGFFRGDEAKSELIKWVSTFSCGIQMVDDQHKELVKLINDMFNHVSGNEQEEREYFKSIVHKMLDYVKLHFQTEEKLMLLTKFPGYREHKEAHDSFALHTISVIKNYTGNNRLTLLDITKFLKDWVLSHIAIMDMEYFVYFKKIAVRDSSGKLKITQERIKTL